MAIAVEQWLIGLCDIGAGILFILISVPLVLNKIPMNSFYGFRIPKAFRSEADWYAINEYGGRALGRWSLGLIVSGVLKLSIPIQGTKNDFVALIIVLGPIMLFVTVPIIQTLLYSWRRK